MPPASAQDRSFADRLAALDAQFAKSASDRAQQVSLVDTRLQSTRAALVAGHNINASSLAIRFTNAASAKGTRDQSAAFNTVNHIAPAKKRRTERYALWFGGNVTVDAQRALNPRAATLFSNGLAFGADARLGSRFLIGNAVGAAFDRTAVGGEGSLGSQYLSDTFYGSYFTGPNTYLDMALGASRVDFTSHFPGDSAATGLRGATQVFGSLRYSRNLRKGKLTIRPYGGATVSYTALDDYREWGQAALFCPSQSRRAIDFSLGLRTETTFALSAGQLRPHANLAVKQTMSEASGAVLVSRDDTDASATVSAKSASSAAFAATTGLDWKINESAIIKTLYSVTANDADFFPRQTVSASFTLRF